MAVVIVTLLLLLLLLSCIGQPDATAYRRSLRARENSQTTARQSMQHQRSRTGLPFTSPFFSFYILCYRVLNCMVAVVDQQQVNASTNMLYNFFMQHLRNSYDFMTQY